MKMNKISLLSLIVSVIAMVSVFLFHKTPDKMEQVNAKETIYERILKTGTIRCGYALYAPLLIKDPNTGELSGVFYDIANEMAKELDLKIEWGTEVGYGEIEEGFVSNKYDMFCTGAVVTPKRAKYVLYTTPVYFQTIFAWVRANDNRFNKSLDSINSPEIKIIAKDGDVQEIIARKSFPKAKIISSPQLLDYTQLLVDVQTGKADVAFFEKSFGDNYLTNNPGTVKMIMPDQPVDINPVSMMLPMEESGLKSAVDATLTKLVLNGFVTESFRKNAPDYDLWSVAPRYRH